MGEVEEVVVVFLFFLCDEVVYLPSVFCHPVNNSSVHSFILLCLVYLFPIPCRSVNYSLVHSFHLLNFFLFLIY